MAKKPAIRILAALELLQARQSISGSELAKRLAVDRRTVRRYIAALEDIGIPITAERGPEGGYSLVAGFKLPPMMFSNEEAAALALGLAAVRCDGVESAQAKLERVMPPEVRARARAIRESVQMAPLRVPDGELLALLSAAAHNRHGVRLRYRSAAERDSERDFDVYGLAVRHGRWYAAGYCHLRRGLRSFRLDRVIGVEAQTRVFARPDDFDLTSFLTQSIATLPRKHTITIAIRADTDSIRHEVFPAIGVFEANGDGALLHSQADDLDWFARELARLPWPFEVLRPAALRAAIRKHALRLLATSPPAQVGELVQARSRKARRRSA
jgi:predicted DNA-binding transcriptional regulator YafY